MDDEKSNTRIIELMEKSLVVQMCALGIRQTRSQGSWVRVPIGSTGC